MMIDVAQGHCIAPVPFEVLWITGGVLTRQKKDPHERGTTTVTPCRHKNAAHAAAADSKLWLAMLLIV